MDQPFTVLPTQGGYLNRTIDFFDRLMQRYTPDPFVFAVLLSFLVMGMGVGMTAAGPVQMLGYWGEGFWNLTTFTLQMVMVLLGGYLIAASAPVQAMLRRCASLVSNNGQAVVMVTLVSALTSWINWGFGLIAGAFLALELARNLPQANFRLLVASAYSGFIVWHGGLSGSIPLLLNTEGNFSQQWTGSTIPVTETLFSVLNITLLMSMVIVLPLLNWLLSRHQTNQVSLPAVAPEPADRAAATPVEKLERSSLLGVITALAGLSYVLLELVNQSFSLDINRVNFIFLFLALLLHKNFRNFLDATMEGASKVGPLLIQYPFYAGIMYMMTESGLANQISEGFVSIASERTFSLYAFFSAGLINFFVPSGGGQWAVQAPIVIQAADSMGLDLAKPVMAVAWGDAWTNLAQPFWALPILAIAGLKARDIMGYCLISLIVSGAIISAWLLLL